MLKIQSLNLIGPNSRRPQRLAKRSSLMKSYLYLNLKSQGVDVILDDRNKRIGFMLSDWDLIGIPIRILISPKTIANNECEIKLRSESESKIINLDKLDDFLNE